MFERLVKVVDDQLCAERRISQMVLRKTPAQIAHHAAGRARSSPRCTRRARARRSRARRPPISTRAAREVLERRGARSNFLGYHGFPAVACISPNEVIVHGIPGDRVLDDGDIVSIDCGAIIEGWHADAAITVPVGDDRRRVAAADRRDPGRRSRPRSRTVRPGNRLGDVGAAVEGVVAAAGFSVVREYVGHGIGTAMHEEPDVPNYGPAGPGLRLREGMVLAIEPMVNAGRATTRTARRRLDRRHRRRLPRRALRAHRRDHRRRPRGPDRSRDAELAGFGVGRALIR